MAEEVRDSGMIKRIIQVIDTPRALPAEEILKRYEAVSGERALAIPSVPAAVRRALELATPDTIIYIGGSTFVVADALPLFQA